MNNNIEIKLRLDFFTENLINELNPINYCIEKEKITLELKSTKVLMINILQDKLMYSFFINKELLSCGIIDNEEKFIVGFKKYLNSETENTDF